MANEAAVACAVLACFLATPSCDVAAVSLAVWRAARCAIESRSINRNLTSLGGGNAAAVAAVGVDEVADAIAGGVPDEFEWFASDDMIFTPEGSTLAPAPPIGGFTSISH